MGVLQLPPSTNFRDALLGMFAQSEQRRQNKGAADEQQRQFELTHDLNKRTTEASERQSGAETAKVTQEMVDQQFKTAIGPFVERMKQASAEGNEPLKQQISAEIQSNPAFQEYRRMAASLIALGGMPSLNSERATGNATSYAADATGRVKAGGQDVMDVNLATKFATGEQLSAPAFGTQTQIDPRAANTKTSFGEMAGVSRGAIPDANTKLREETSVKTTGMQIGANARLIDAQVRAADASARADDAKTAAGGPTTTKPLSGEAAKVQSIATTLIPELKALRGALKQDFKKSVMGMVSGTNRNLVRLRDNAADKVGRLRSGGAINKDEEKRFLAQIASWKDLPFGQAKDATDAIDRLIEEAEQVKAGIAGQRVGGSASTEADPLGIL